MLQNMHLLNFYKAVSIAQFRTERGINMTTDSSAR